MLTKYSVDFLSQSSLRQYEGTWAYRNRSIFWNPYLCKLRHTVCFTAHVLGSKELMDSTCPLTQYLFEILLGQPSRQCLFVVVEPLFQPPPKHCDIPEDRFTSCPGFKFHFHFQISYIKAFGICAQLQRY